jgi:hypothetical protein
MTAAPAPGATGSGATGSGAAPRRRGGPPIWFAVFGLGGVLLGVLLIAAELLGLRVGVPGVSATIPPTGAAAQMTHDRVQAALEAASFQVRDPQTAFRPGESSSLIAAPRRLLQAVLPSDPQGGYVVIYELPSANDADSVGRDFVRYLASGTGAIQYPRDAQFVIRRMGQTLVFFPWSPSVSPDPSVARLAATIESIGVPLTGQ